MDDHAVSTVNVNDPGVEPHVWTKFGLLPESSLEYHHDWEFTPGDNGVLRQIRFREWYVLRQTGEVVKEAPHIYINQPLTSEAAVGNIH